MKPIKILLSIAVLLVLAFAGGVGWTYYDLNIRDRPWILSNAQREALHAETLAGFDAMSAGRYEEALAI